MGTQSDNQHKLSVIESIHYLISNSNEPAHSDAHGTVHTHSDFANPRLSRLGGFGSAANSTSNSIIAATPTIRTQQTIIQQCIDYLDRQNMCAEIEALREKFVRLRRDRN